MELRAPSLELLPDYKKALEQGWSPDNLRPQAGQEHLDRIAQNPELFVQSLSDPEARGGPIKLPDGSEVPRLPSMRWWIWDGAFCGHIGFRWQKGTEALPPTCSGHIGYSVVPWKRGQGLATKALIGVLPTAKSKGLAHVTITTSPENPASIRVIEKAGGKLADSYQADKALGGHETLEFRVSLNGS